MGDFKPCQIQDGFLCRWTFGDTTFTKCIDRKELDITLLAAKNDLTPSIISWLDKEDHFDITMEKYERTLAEETHENVALYQKQIEELVRKLHGIGVYHGDLCEDNIVVKNGVVKLIDFGCSCFHAEITKAHFANNMYGERYACVTELIQAEYDYIALFCRSSHE